MELVFKIATEASLSVTPSVTEMINEAEEVITSEPTLDVEVKKRFIIWGYFIVRKED